MRAFITERDQLKMEEIVTVYLFGDGNFYESNGSWRLTHQECEQLGIEIVNQILNFLLEKEE